MNVNTIGDNAKHNNYAQCPHYHDSIWVTFRKCLDDGFGNLSSTWVDFPVIRDMSFNLSASSCPTHLGNYPKLSASHYGYLRWMQITELITKYFIWTENDSFLFVFPLKTPLNGFITKFPLLSNWSGSVESIALASEQIVWENIKLWFSAIWWDLKCISQKAKKKSKRKMLLKRRRVTRHSIVQLVDTLKCH